MLSDRTTDWKKSVRRALISLSLRLFVHFRKQRTMDATKIFKWNDAHFCSLSSQTNVYGLSKIKTENNTNKLLVSSIHRNFVSIEYQKTGDKLTPLTKDILFTYIPGDAEIVSMDAMTRLPPNRGLVVGITFIKPEDQENRPISQILIYTGAPLGEENVEESIPGESKLEVMTDGCQHINLEFRPFLLTHTALKIQQNTEPEAVFLLCGSDCKVHMYQEIPAEHGFREEPCDCYFPEFVNLNSNILQLVIKTTDCSHRLTAIGLQDGEVRVTLVDTDKKEIIKVWIAEMDSPVTSLSFFSHLKCVPYPSFLEAFKICNTCQNSPAADSVESLEINLLMTSALGQGVVYRDVIGHGLSEVLWLPDSDRYDVALCSLAADIDFDGQNEILVGTYGQEVLVYKYFPTTEKSVPVESDEMSNWGVDVVTDLRNTRPYSMGDQADDSSKHRHKSDEGSATEKTLPQRKVKSEEDLSLLNDFNLDLSKKAAVNTGHQMQVKTVQEPHYKLLWQRSFPCPVMKLDCADMMGDGLENLIVLTMHGVHIMQPDLNEVSALLISRLQQLCLSKPEAADVPQT